MNFLKQYRTLKYQKTVGSNLGRKFFNCFRRRFVWKGKGAIYPMTVKLTQDDILAEIEGYKKRIYEAQQKLSALHKNLPGSQERKKIKFKRKVLEQEISHVKKLILIAKEALEDLLLRDAIKGGSGFFPWIIC